MRALIGLMAGVTLMASGCSVDLDVDVVDAQGNPTVVQISGEDPASADQGASQAEPTPTPQPTTQSGAASTAEETPTAGTESDTTPTADPSPTEAVGQTTPTVTGSASPTTTPSPAPTATPTPAPTSTPTPTPTPSPTPTPTPVPIEFVIAPDAALLGVEVGSEATAALTSLEAVIGPPDFDSGWYVGCPLDGDELDERLVQWGDLNVYFDRSDGDEIMRGWGYDLRIVDGGFPEIDLIQLPGGARMGEPVNEVAAAAELEVRYDALFDINRVGEDGFELLADAPPGAPVWGAFVPAIPTCE